ncbi:pilus assembly protein PilP [Hylemonella gracilis]|nr:pilus assembly protein PilP [Hylemonella gracilis]
MSLAPHGGLGGARLGALLILLLAGCEPADESALRAWMAEQRRQYDAGTAVTAAPTPAVAGVESIAGTAGRVEAEDPFDPRRLSGSQPLQQQAAARTDQPLEARPLSSLRMVGSLRQGDQVVALVQADLQVYQVPVGAVLGSNRARVLRISEDGITLREALRGPQGEPLARVLTLPMQGR